MHQGHIGDHLCRSKSCRKNLHTWQLLPGDAWSGMLPGRKMLLENYTSLSFYISGIRKNTTVPLNIRRLAELFVENV